jgi:HD superfamily phosphohydrolase
MAVVQRIRDPIHSLIEFDDSDVESALWQAIQTRPFQRLRRVKQLGFSDYVYPGASHSRFSHSVGVFHTARQLLRVIQQRSTTPYKRRQAETALAAALLHDIGHGPFSHAFESVGKKLGLKLARHEYVSEALIRGSEISAVLNQLGSGFADDVAEVIKAKGPRTLYDAVVSSQFDADRLDYMRRDRVMAGSKHGEIDYDWLVANLEIADIPMGVDDVAAGTFPTFVVGSKSIEAAEAYVLGLFQLYLRLGRQAFCQGDWIEAGLKLIDLSGGDAVEARMFDESDIGAASDALLARYVKTYVEAKRAADRKRADQPKDKAVSLPMDELFERKR